MVQYTPSVLNKCLEFIVNRYVYVWFFPPAFSAPPCSCPSPGLLFPRPNLNHFWHFWHLSLPQLRWFRLTVQPWSEQPGLALKVPFLSEPFSSRWAKWLMGHPTKFLKNTLSWFESNSISWDLICKGLVSNQWALERWWDHKGSNCFHELTNWWIYKFLAERIGKKQSSQNLGTV